MGRCSQVRRPWTLAINRLYIDRLTSAIMPPDNHRCRLMFKMKALILLLSVLHFTIASGPPRINGLTLDSSGRTIRLEHSSQSTQNFPPPSSAAQQNQNHDRRPTERGVHYGGGLIQGSSDPSLRAFAVDYYHRLNSEHGSRNN